jgi:hypothetical protein
MVFESDDERSGSETDYGRNLSDSELIEDDQRVASLMKHLTGNSTSHSKKGYVSLEKLTDNSDSISKNVDDKTATEEWKPPKGTPWGGAKPFVFQETNTVNLSEVSPQTKAKFHDLGVKSRKWRSVTNEFFSSSSDVPKAAPEPFVEPVEFKHEKTSWVEKDLGKPRRLLNKAPVTSIPPQCEARTSSKNTRMCKFAGKCRKQGCDFAHTLEELQPASCRFDVNCRKRNVDGSYACRFYHSDEDKAEYLKRRDALESM